MTEVKNSQVPIVDGASAEELLLASVAEGDRDAMARLFALHSRLVFSVSRRILQDPAAAEDVMQEVFLQVWRDPSRFSSARGRLGSFLAVVARNKAIDILRQRRPSDSVEDVQLAWPGSVADDVERHLMIERVRNVMEHLPAEQSKTLEKAFFGGWTHNEIAAMTGTTLGTVKTRVRSALQALKEVFGK